MFSTGGSCGGKIVKIFAGLAGGAQSGCSTAGPGRCQPPSAASVGIRWLRRGRGAIFSLPEPSPSGCSSPAQVSDGWGLVKNVLVRRISWGPKSELREVRSWTCSRRLGCAEAPGGGSAPGSRVGSQKARILPGSALGPASSPLKWGRGDEERPSRGAAASRSPAVTLSPSPQPKSCETLEKRCHLSGSPFPPLCACTSVREGTCVCLCVCVRACVWTKWVSSQGPWNSSLSVT